MIGFVLWMLILAYFSLFVIAWRKNASWKKRGIWWLVILSPVAVWGWDYPLAYYAFEQQCEAEGGLRVFKDPEKSSRVRLEGDLGGYDAKFMLRALHPRLLAVEVQGDVGEKPFEYSVQKSGQKEYLNLNGWIFNQTPLVQLDPALYVLRAINDNPLKSTQPKRIMQLEKNGEVFARWTSLTYVWRRGLFSESIGFHCYQWGSPEQRSFGLSPGHLLVNLLLK